MLKLQGRAHGLAKLQLCGVHHSMEHITDFEECATDEDVICRNHCLTMRSSQNHLQIAANIGRVNYLEGDKRKLIILGRI